MTVSELRSPDSEPQQILRVTKRHTFVKSQHCYRIRIGFGGPGGEVRATTSLSTDGGWFSRARLDALMEGGEVQVHTIRVFTDSRDPILIQEQESREIMTLDKQNRRAYLKLRTLRKTM